METCIYVIYSNCGGVFSCLASLATIEKSQLAVGKVTFLPKERQGSQIKEDRFYTIDNVVPVHLKTEAR